MRDEFYKMEFERWDEGTFDLSLEQEAAFLRLCHQMYRRHGSVPNSIKLLCLIWRCHANKATALLKALIDAGKVSIDPDGNLTNEKVDRTLTERRQLADKRKTAGTQGGHQSGLSRAKALKNKEPNEASASTPRTREEKSREDKNRKEDISAVPTARAAKPSEEFEKFWKVYPKRDGANPKHPAEKQFAIALKSGAKPEEITGGAERYRAQLRSKGEEGGKYVKQAQYWLKEQRWKDYPATAVTADLEDEFKRIGRMLQTHRDRGGPWPFPSEPRNTLNQALVERWLEENPPAPKPQDSELFKGAPA